MADPRSTLVDVTETAVRTVVGSNKLDYILTDGRTPMKIQIQERIQALINEYGAGLRVTSVNTQPAKPPEEVKSAFDDVIKAREDKERAENEATAYANRVVPEARGVAARIKEEAQAYKEQVIAQAEGESDRFLKLLGEYQKAPEVTRQRLYLETMESVLQSTDKVLLDTQSGNNLLYLPLERNKGMNLPALPPTVNSTATTSNRLPPVPPNLIQRDGRSQRRAVREVNR